MSCSTPGTFPCWPHRKRHAWWDSEEKAWQCLCTLTAKTDPKIKRWQFCLLWRWITSARSVSGNYFRNFIAHLRHVHTCRDLEVNERQIRKTVIRVCVPTGLGITGLPTKMLRSDTALLVLNCILLLKLIKPYFTF